MPPATLWRTKASAAAAIAPAMTGAHCTRPKTGRDAGPGGRLASPESMDVIALPLALRHNGARLASASADLAGQIVVLQQDAVLERQMPALDLPVCHRMIGRAADMRHVLFVEPRRQLHRDVARPVVG